MDLPCIIRIQFLPRDETISERPVSTAGGVRAVDVAWLAPARAEIGQDPSARFSSVSAWMAPCPSFGGPGRRCGMWAVCAIGLLRSSPSSLIASRPINTAASAERYYRAMFHSRHESWNLRDTHMFETLNKLSAHLDSGARRSSCGRTTRISEMRAPPR
jgi:erythromycin esterase-like protein